MHIKQYRFTRIDKDLPVDQDLQVDDPALKHIFPYYISSQVPVPSSLIEIKAYT